MNSLKKWSQSRLAGPLSPKPAAKSPEYLKAKKEADAADIVARSKKSKDEAANKKAEEAHRKAAMLSMGDKSAYGKHTRSADFWADAHEYA